jgi:hypothetical protein
MRLTSDLEIPALDPMAFFEDPFRSDDVRVSVSGANMRLTTKHTQRDLRLHESQEINSPQVFESRPGDGTRDRGGRVMAENEAIFRYTSRSVSTVRYSPRGEPNREG